MPIVIVSWSLFCIAFGLMLLLTFIMNLQSANFYTNDSVIKKFSIMDLELPATATELVNLIKGLYKLPQPQSKKALSSLKGQLYIDFIFMPFAYGSIFLLSMMVSSKMQTPYGKNLFLIFAWLQIIPWLCDIIENIYLLNKIKPNPDPSTPEVHKTYLRMELFKWGIALSATICGIAAMCYFWLSGNYTAHSLLYSLIIVGEIILFFMLGRFIKKPKIN